MNIIKTKQIKRTQRLVNRCNTCHKEVVLKKHAFYHHGLIKVLSEGEAVYPDTDDAIASIKRGIDADGYCNIVFMGFCMCGRLFVAPKER